MVLFEGKVVAENGEMVEIRIDAPELSFDSADFQHVPQLKSGIFKLHPISSRVVPECQALRELRSQKSGFNFRVSVCRDIVAV